MYDDISADDIDQSIGEYLTDFYAGECCPWKRE